jgi:hypothetical protein
LPVSVEQVEPAGDIGAGAVKKHVGQRGHGK